MKQKALATSPSQQRTIGEEAKNKSRGKSSRKREPIGPPLDDMEFSNLILEDEELETDLNEDITDDDLSGLLDSEDSDDALGDMDQDEDDEELKSIQKLMKYSEPKTRRKAPVRTKKEVKVAMADENMDSEVEEIEEKPRSRWFMTTCLYCGDMYRFRSDQPQPPTCGKPLCNARFEERMKKKAAMV